MGIEDYNGTFIWGLKTCFFHVANKLKILKSIKVQKQLYNI